MQQFPEHAAGAFETSYLLLSSTKNLVKIDSRDFFVIKKPAEQGVLVQPVVLTYRFDFPVPYIRLLHLHIPRFRRPAVQTPAVLHGHQAA